MARLVLSDSDCERMVERTDQQLSNESQDSQVTRTSTAHATPNPPSDPRNSQNSQYSSLNESMASQLSAPRPGSPGDLEPAHWNSTQGLVTPSTSVSNHSSQEHRDTLPKSTRSGSMFGDQGMDRQDNLQLAIPHVPKPMQRPATSRDDHTSAPKRMANGDIKSVGGNLPRSPTDSNMYMHSRNSSTTSRGSQIGEVRIHPLASVTYG